MAKRKGSRAEPDTGGESPDPDRMEDGELSAETVRLKARAESVDQARLQQQQVASHIIEWARTSQISPGIVMLGLFEFIALMIDTNFPPERRAEEVTRATSYLTDRLAELASDRETRGITH
jgi:hypothetical protein